MTKINDPVNLNGKLFGYEIRYNNPVNPTIAPGRFNGNIAEVDWKNSTEDLLKRYNYEYDNLNRLKNAFYKEPTTGNSTTFDEYLTYDLNGNINTLKRNATPISGGTSTQVDDLEYKYTGNRLNRVIENALNNTGYEGGNNFIDYDLNGNMVNMKDKGIQSIGYNYLNLADSYSITQKDPWGTNTSFRLNYLYRADGAKVRKTYSSGGGRGQSTTNKYTDYLDGFQYSFSETVAPCPWCRTSVAYEAEAFRDPGLFDPIPGTLDWQLDFVPTSEGFYSFTENRYIYQYRDHLGNARVNFAKNTTGALEVTDTNNYYAFGMNHIGGMKSLLGGYQNYKYNGKELQESGMYDYGARMYMPDLGRWGVVDPLAEQMRSHSPYNYAFNNPIRFIDPDGRSAVPPDDYVDPTGRYLGSDGATTKNTRIIYRSDWNNITSENGGSISTTATQALQASSSIVSVNSLQISADVNNANNETIADQTKERQLYLGLKVTRGDVPTAEVTSVRGADGIDGHATFLKGERMDPNTRELQSLVIDTSMTLLGGAHTHNLATRPIKNIPGTSADDVDAAAGHNTTVYSIDSWTGSQNGGNAIHRRTSEGVSTLNVGTTTNQNIGQAALNIHIDKQKHNR